MELKCCGKNATNDKLLKGQMFTRQTDKRDNCKIKRGQSEQRQRGQMLDNFRF